MTATPMPWPRYVVLDAGFASLLAVWLHRTDGRTGQMGVLIGDCLLHLLFKKSLPTEWARW